MNLQVHVYLHHNTFCDEDPQCIFRTHQTPRLYTPDPENVAMPHPLGKQPAMFWRFVPKLRTSGAVLITQLLKITRSPRFRLRRSSSWWSSHCETASNTLTPSRIIEDLKDVLSSAPTPAVLTRTSAASTKFFSLKAEG